MSLVAYGASDESETSDSEETEQSVNNENKVDEISDDEDYQAVSSSTLSSKSQSGPKSILSDFPLELSSVADLPPPQKREDTVIEETELEDEVRQKPSELVNAPKPPKKTKQPVKITIPSLAEVSDEDDVSTKKKAVSSSAPSGLFSLLPAPIHSAKKEINRPLIPHNLGRKPQPSKPAVQAKVVSSSSSSSSGHSDGATNSKSKDVSTDSINNKLPASRNPLISYDSEDDDDDDENDTGSQNFFSLNSKKETNSLPEPDSVTSTRKDVSTASTEEPAPSQRENCENSVAGDSNTATSTTSVDEEAEAVVSPPEPGLINDSPLDFGNARRFSSWSSASSSYLGAWRPQRVGSGAHNSTPSLHPLAGGLQSSVQYNMVDAEESQETEVPSDDLQQVMSDKEFQRLHGKRKRGMEEAISFVDAKVDDYVDPSELSKHITEESEYQSQKSKDANLPTSQQKRKKQITYLAFQAKEKELELKNTWSQNKLTKRQTQAKYGF